MHRDELILRTRQLIAEGERLDAAPSQGALQTWLQLSDDLLATAWGTMDRYHLAWLMVGKSKGIVRGRPMTADEEAAYVREVASQKTAALRMSLDAVERQRMPFRGETGGIGAGQGMGEVPGEVPGEAPGAGSPAPAASPDAAADDPGAIDPTKVSSGAQVGEPSAPTGAQAFARATRRAVPMDPALEERLQEARRAASEHASHGGPRPPNPERMR